MSEPHNPRRPELRGVIKAIENNDIEAVKAALTPRQRRFAEEYVLDFNGTKAAIRAGYAIPNAEKQAHQLVKHRGIAFYIDDILRSREAKTVSVNPDYVIQRVLEIVNKEGARDGDKLRALELLARHLGMFIERTEITGKDGGAIEMEQRVQEESASLISALKRMAQKSPSKPLTLN